MFTRAFWIRAAERALRTFAQAFAAAALLGEPGASVLRLDWAAAAGLAAAATLGSILTSIGSAPISPAGSPSVVD
jgi:hypothetical protein